MSSPATTDREHTADRASSLRVSARADKLRAVRHAGFSALDICMFGGALAWNTSSWERPVFAIAAAIGTVVSATVAVWEGIDSIAGSTTAAALEGALVQHELAGVPFDESERHYFPAPEK